MQCLHEQKVMFHDSANAVWVKYSADCCGVFDSVSVKTSQNIFICIGYREGRSASAGAKDACCGKRSRTVGIKRLCWLRLCLGKGAKNVRN